MAKKRIVKDYDALPEDILHGVKQAYPGGYATHLISYTDAKGKKVSALPFETEDVYYLIRMTMNEAKQLIKDDEDYDDEGQLIKAPVLDDVEVDEEFDGKGEEDDDVAAGMDDEDDHIIVTRRRGRDEDDDVADDSSDY